MDAGAFRESDEADEAETEGVGCALMLLPLTLPSLSSVPAGSAGVLGALCDREGSETGPSIGLSEAALLLFGTPAALLISEAAAAALASAGEVAGGDGELPPA